jgi:hypothetical protein
MKTIAAKPSRPIAGRVGLIVGIAICAGLATLDQIDGYEIATPDKIEVAETGLWTLMTILALWLVFFRRVLGWIDAGIDYAKSFNFERLQFRAKATSVETILSVLFVISLVAFPINAYFRTDVAFKMIDEDTPIEYLTAIFYLIACASCIVLAIRAKGKGWLRFHLGVLAFLFFFVGMEEMSWGQRIFNFRTPDAIGEINNQDEFTIHNLYSISLFQYPGLAITCFLLCVFPLWQRYSRRWSGLMTALQFPVAPIRCAWLYLAAIVSYFVLGFIFKTPTPLPISFGPYWPSSDDEYLEFYLSCLFLIFSITNWRILLPKSGDR